MKCPECNEELEKGAKFCGNCGVDIEVALSERVKKEAKNREQEEKKLKEKLKENNQNSKQIDEEDKIVDPEVDEEIKKIKEEFIKNEEREIPKFIEENKNETLEQKPKFQKKNEKTKVKKHNYGKIFIVLIILIVLIFGIVYQLHRMNILPESINNVVSPVFEKLDDIFSKKKGDNNSNEVKNNNENLVYDYYTAKINGKTSKIPNIQINSENVPKINEEIVNLTEDKLKEAEKNTSKNKTDLKSVNYEWHINEDILSLVLVISYKTGKDEYYVYNINVQTGDNVENDEIIEKSQVPKDEFTNTCFNIVSDYFSETYASNNQNNNALEYLQARSNTVNKSNFKISNSKIFLDEDGKLVFVAKIYGLKEPEETEKEFNLEKDDKQEKSENETDEKTLNTINPNE